MPYNFSCDCIACKNDWPTQDSVDKGLVPETIYNRLKEISNYQVMMNKEITVQILNIDLSMTNPSQQY